MENRIIKFRNWDDSRNRMTHWEDLLKYSTDDVFSEDENDEFFVGRLMQYLCAKDWHGVEIYEGDIVSVNKKGEEHFTGQVKYNSQCCGFYITNGNRYVQFSGCAQSWTADDPNVVYYNNIEVVGNVCENPEQLNGSSATPIGAASFPKQ
jgi:uncharacterized phage protein (TIGR01671 family)